MDTKPEIDRTEETREAQALLTPSTKRPFRAKATVRNAQEASAAGFGAMFIPSCKEWQE